MVLKIQKIYELLLVMQTLIFSTSFLQKLWMLVFLKNMDVH
ncbi:hypothetical protein CKA32_002895 [Geitlerinema sp. FC II]|nr:hypothetical protein CKA32_002895 [Geitlerinema sp. FC II]